jgi:hypothetical protein
MRKFANLLISFTLATAAVAQSQPPASVPQTARQALLEMLFSQTPGTFVKHLPTATLEMLQKSGGLATLQQYSMLAGQLQTKDKKLETFETGRVLLSAGDPQSGKKFEVTVENDSLQGDEDNLEVSFETYKDQQVQRTPFLPRMNFVMKLDAGVWKLSEILITVRLPLADPDFLKSIADGIKARAAGAPTPAIQPLAQASASSNNSGSDASVIAAMRSILTAEKTYGTTYRAVGYTCTLSDLDGFGGGEANEHQAMLISSGLASGKKFGYIFTLSGCSGNPATGYHLGAAPGGTMSFGRRAYCADQSGVIRHSTDGNVASCFVSGVPLP